MKNVILPRLAEGVEEATISYWHFEVGDSVREGDDLVEATTDKASFNIPAPASGTIESVLFEEGDTVKAGDVLAIIDEAKEQG